MDEYAHEILCFISRNTSDVSFYHLARGFGWPDAPLQETLRSFSEDGLIEIANPEAGVNNKYAITAKGVSVLNDYASK